MNIKSALKLALASLQQTSSTPHIDAELLLAKALNTRREYLFSHPEHQLSKKQFLAFVYLLMRRIDGEPIAHILGKREFWSLELKVNKDALIPRPESELLVEIALQTIKKTTARIADLGTGTGAIALALAKEKPGWEIIATDKSKKALKLARENAKLNKLHNITFIQGDWCEPLQKKYNVIISNPPYIAKDDIHLQQGDNRFEPIDALIAGDDGMSSIKIICKDAVAKLEKNGILLLEHGATQKNSVSKLMRAQGFTNIKTFKDLAGKDRVTIGYRK